MIIEIIIVTMIILITVIIVTKIVSMCKIMVEMFSHCSAQSILK